MSRPVGLHRPHLHLAETLTAELGLAAERLLGDQTVRADRTGMDLVVDQMVQLEHIHDADRDLLLERFAGTAVIQGHLPVVRHAGPLQFGPDLALVNPFKDR